MNTCHIVTHYNTTQPVRVIAFDHTETHLAYTTANGELHILELQILTGVSVLLSNDIQLGAIQESSLDPDNFYALEYHPDDSFLVSKGAFRLAVWDTPKKNMLVTVRLSPDTIGRSGSSSVTTRNIFASSNRFRSFGRNFRVEGKGASQQRGVQFDAVFSDTVRAETISCHLIKDLWRSTYGRRRVTRWCILSLELEAGRSSFVKGKRTCV